jgi:hypothetical protein
MSITADKQHSISIHRIGTIALSCRMACLQCRLKAEGFSDEDIIRAVPYAMKALGIATASVGGVGIIFSGIIYASGADIKQHAELSNFKDTWAMVAGKEYGRALAGKFRDLLQGSEQESLNADSSVEGRQYGHKAHDAEKR